MNINLGLYALLVLIPWVAISFVRTRKIGRKHSNTFWVLIAIISVLTVPSFFVRLNMNPTAWQPIGFIPSKGTIALDGNVLILGGDPVQIYRFQDGEWMQEATLTQENSDDSKFGAFVELDGDTAFMVDVDEPHPNGGSGTIYASTYDGAQWSSPTRLPIPPDADSDSGSPGTILAADGNVLVNGSNESDVVYVYERETELAPWKFKTRLLPPAATNRSDDRITGFGPAVAVDGDTIVVGCRESQSGVTVFVRNRETDQWEFQASLDRYRSFSKPTATPYGTGLGNSVAIEGDVLIAGATGMNLPDGIVFVYRRNTATGRWKRVDSLTPVGGRALWSLERYFPIFPFFPIPALGTYGFGADVKMSGLNIAVSTGNIRNPGRNRVRKDAFVYRQNVEGRMQWQQQLLLDGKGVPGIGTDYSGGVGISEKNLAAISKLNGEQGITLFRRRSNY